MKLIMGIYDAPEIQEQPLLEIDPLKANIAVFGSPMSGKTKFIETMLLRLTSNIGKGTKEDVYIIDFGGNIGDYADLPVVCACFDNSNEENIKRVFKIIDDRLRENARQLGSKNYYMAASKPDTCPPHLTLIIENLNAFLADERFATYQDQLMKLCRDGLSKGLTVVFTANDTSGISRYLANFGHKIAFNMPATSYMDIFGSKSVSTMRTPGRGLVTVDSGVYEFQAFLPFKPKTEEDDLKALIAQYQTYKNPNKLISLPDILTMTNIREYSADKIQPSNDNIYFGLDYYDHKPMIIDIDKTRSIGIYGKKGFGKTNLLKILTAQIWMYHRDARFILFDDGRKQLETIRDTILKNNKNTVYYDNATDLRAYLNENGYGATRKANEKVEVQDTPYTVFILQNRMLYHNSSGTDIRYLSVNLFPDMIVNAEKRKFLFIYSDFKIPETEFRDKLNNCLSAAFLLDNIGDFIAEKGAKTAFGEMDPKELKAQYAKCSLGDGYYYDIEGDDLHKVKLIKFEGGKKNG